MQDQVKKAEDIRVAALRGSAKVLRKLWTHREKSRAHIAALAGSVHRASKRARAAEAEADRLRAALEDIDRQARQAIKSAPGEILTAAYKIRANIMYHLGRGWK